MVGSWDAGNVTSIRVQALGPGAVSHGVGNWACKASWKSVLGGITFESRN